ncbi:MAG: GNAT family N-acetyltransferase [Bacteroidota bacterium]
MEIRKEQQDTKGRLVAFDGNREMGEMTYSLANEGELLIVDHTGVEKEYEGKGVGKSLFFKLVEMVRDEKKKIMPLCPFVRSMFERNKDQWDVLRNGSL